MFLPFAVDSSDTNEIYSTVTGVRMTGVRNGCHYDNKAETISSHGFRKGRCPFPAVLTTFFPSISNIVSAAMCMNVKEATRSQSPVPGSPT